MISKYAKLKEDTVKLEEYRRKDGSINMCKGIRDLISDSKAEGREEGREEGIELGVEQTRKSIVKNMLRKNKTIEEICDVIGCDMEYVERIKEELA